MIAANWAYAATWSQITGFSAKLEENKTQLLKNLDASKEKLASTAKENSAIIETSLFKAASCLWAISEEDQDLDLNTLVSWLKETILNEYIELDWNIKRLSFGLLTEDPIVFWNAIDSYYNQNAQKITNLENDYYTKTTNAKNNFLEYVDNNSELLNWLAIKLDAFNAIQKAANDVTKALDDFSWAVNKKSSLLTDLGNTRAQAEEEFESQLDAIITESIATYSPNWDTQAQYYIHKDNYLKKFRLEEKKAEYYLFSAIFSYEKYSDLLDRKANVDKQFVNTEGNLDCSILLTTTFNIWSYAKDVASVSESLVKGINLSPNATIKVIVNVFFRHFWPVFPDSSFKSVQVFLARFVVISQFNVGYGTHFDSVHFSKDYDVFVPASLSIWIASAVFFCSHVLELVFCNEISDSQCMSFLACIQEWYSASVPWSGMVSEVHVVWEVYCPFFKRGSCVIASFVIGTSILKASSFDVGKESFFKHVASIGYIPDVFLPWIYFFKSFSVLSVFIDVSKSLPVVISHLRM